MNLAEGIRIEYPFVVRIEPNYIDRDQIPTALSIRVITFKAELTKIGKYSYEKHFRCQECLSFIRSAYDVEVQGAGVLKHYCMEPI